MIATRHKPKTAYCDCFDQLKEGSPLSVQGDNVLAESGAAQHDGQYAHLTAPIGAHNTLGACRHTLLLAPPACSTVTALLHVDKAR